MVEIPTALCGGSNILEGNSWARDISGRRKPKAMNVTLHWPPRLKTACPTAVCRSHKILLGGGVGWGGRDSRRDPRTGRVRTGRCQAAGSKQLSMLGAGDASLTVQASGN